LPEYQKIKKLVAKLVYSPLSHNQLVGSAELLLPETQQDGYVELDLYLNGPFQASSLPMVLTHAKSHKVIQVNEVFLRQFNVYRNQIVSTPWHDLLATEQQQKIEKYQAKLSETGRLEILSGIELDNKIQPMKLCLFYLSFDGEPYYLVEFHNQADHVFQQKFSYFLDKISAIDFVSERSDELLKNMVKWSEIGR